MSIKVTDRFIAPSRGTVADVDAFFDAHPPCRIEESKRVARRVFALSVAANFDYSLPMSRIADETGATSGDVDRFLVSPIYCSRLNIGGLGVTDGGDLGISFDTPEEAADAYMAHLFTYVLGNNYNVLGVTPSTDIRFNATPAAWRGSVETLDDLRGKWFTNPQGAINSANRGNAIFPDIGDQQSGGTKPMTYSISIPGLPGGPLVTDYPIAVDILPESMTLNRPGTKANRPRKSLQHGDGNPNATAIGERNFLFAGAPDNNGQPQQLSYHATGDDNILYVLIPLDEVTWQAADGGGPGNMNGYSCEMVENAELWSDSGRIHKVIHNCADFMGRCAARLDCAKAERHWDYNWGECCDAPCDVQCGNRHHCPDMLMSRTVDGRPAWDVYVQQWNAAKADELQRMSGQPQPQPTPEPTPEPPKPLKLPKGMSTGVARLLFNPHDLRAPGGSRIPFTLTGKIAKAWLKHGLDSIPEGKDWKEGQWPAMTQVIRRGDGRVDYQFGHWVYEQ